MIVNIVDYGERDGRKFIEYMVLGLSSAQLSYLDSNLDEDTSIDDDNLILTMYFDEKLYPFQSDAAKIRIDDFVSREEIEMNIFISGFLEDM